MKKMNLRELFLLAIMSATALALSHCGSTGSGLLPQATLPVPSNDDITIQSDGSGYLIATGSPSSDVPDEATVVFEISDGSTSLNLMRYLPSLISAATAAEDCAPEIPSCPELNADNQCKVQAGTDGSFSATFPGDAGDSVTYWWYDPADSCSEAEHYIQEIAADTIAATGISPVSWLDTDNNMLIVFGQDVSGGGHLLNRYTFNATTSDDSVDITIEMEELSIPVILEGGARLVRHFISADAESYYFLQTDQDNLLASIDDSTTYFENFILLADETEVENLSLSLTHTITPETDETELFSCSGYDYTSGESYTQLFFSKIYDEDTGSEAALYMTPALENQSGTTINMMELNQSLIRDRLVSGEESFVTSSADIVANRIDWMGYSSSTDQLYLSFRYQNELGDVNQYFHTILSFDARDCVSASNFLPQSSVNLESQLSRELLQYQFEDGDFPVLYVLQPEAYTFEIVALDTLIKTNEIMDTASFDPDATIDALESFAVSQLSDGTSVAVLLASVTTTAGESDYRIYVYDFDSDAVLSISTNEDTYLPDVIGDGLLFADTIDDSPYTIFFDENRTAETVPTSYTVSPFQLP